jgi:hypothetical protein
MRFGSEATDWELAPYAREFAPEDSHADDDDEEATGGTSASTMPMGHIDISN